MSSYFFNDVTGETTYDWPEAAGDGDEGASTAVALAEDEPPLPPGWAAHVSTTSGDRCARASCLCTRPYMDLVGGGGGGLTKHTQQRRQQLQAAAAAAYEVDQQPGLDDVVSAESITIVCAVT